MYYFFMHDRTIYLLPVPILEYMILKQILSQRENSFFPADRSFVRLYRMSG